MKSKMHSRLWLIVSAVVIAGAGLVYQQSRALAVRNSLRHVIKAASAVGIDWGAPGASAKASTTAVKMTQLQPKSRMLLLLNTSHGFHAMSSGAKQDLNFWITTRLDEPLRIYGYSSSNGEIGAGKEWCYAPPEFNRWIKEQMRIVPMQKPFKVHRVRGVIIVD